MRWAVAIVAALLVGCSAPPAPSPAPPPPTISAVIPQDGISLAELGFKHAPSGFSVPAETVLLQAVDQPNVVTIVASKPAIGRFADYLRRHLPAMGFRITADSGDALLFSNGGTEGALAGETGRLGLTLRKLR